MGCHKNINCDKLLRLNNAVNKIVEVLDSKKATDIEVLNVSSLTTMTAYFIIATGNNDRLTRALCDHVEEELEKTGVSVTNKEGYRSGDWILLGFDEVVVHIFMPEARNFYNLEHIWQDGIRVDVSDIVE